MGMVLGESVTKNDTLPLFPLRTVFFPGEIIPLHIFEERYKSLIKNCMKYKTTFGIVLIESGKENSTEVIPYRMGTEAEIEQCIELQDGRLYIFVSGKRKFKIDRFNYSKEYLSGKIKWLQEDIHGVNKEVEKLAFSLASDYIKYLRTMNSTFKMELNKGNTELLSYQIAQVLDLSNEYRQRILETKSTEERLQMEIQVMREYVNTSPSTSYG